VFLYAQIEEVAAIHQAMAREVNSFLARIFSERRKAGRLDLEAIEMEVRSALHQAGAAACGHR
jgi:hypothetical protein